MTGEGAEKNLHKRGPTGKKPGAIVMCGQCTFLCTLGCEMQSRTMRGRAEAWN